ncbi:4Fe-4S binding protein [Pelomyxa schiedti]|nr:4Fe-4S binding protein [Pelomyxa schiedti]
MAVGKLTIARHVVQSIVLVALNSSIFGVPVLPWLMVPILHCTKSPFSIAVGTFDAIEYSLSHAVVPILSLGVTFLTAILVGKFLCGWACPMGFAQDLISYIPYPRSKLSPNTASSLKDIKWGVLAFSVLCCGLAAWRRSSIPDVPEDNAVQLAAAKAYAEAPIGVFSDAPFGVISPSCTLFCYLPNFVVWTATNVLAVAGLVAWLKIGVFVACVASCIVVPRFFCRFVCPLAALMEFVMPFKVLSIKCQKGHHDKFNALLSNVCPVGCNHTVTEDSINKEQLLQHPGCIHCGNCLAADPNITHCLSW